MSGCDDLKALLAPLGLYDLSAGTRNEAELFALGAALDGVDAALTAAEREALVPTAVGEGLALREALLPWRPAAETLAERRAAIRALLCIDGDSLTLAAVNRAIQGCGIRAQVRETGVGTVEVWFPGQQGVPAQFERIRRILLDLLPCHLAVTFCFRYLSWE